MNQSITETVAESDGATLTRTITVTGHWPFRKTAVSCQCRCPFACLATYEPCEFKGLYDRYGNPVDEEDGSAP